jgi:hypothetical protein
VQADVTAQLRPIQDQTRKDERLPSPDCWPA